MPQWRTDGRHVERGCLDDARDSQCFKSHGTQLALKKTASILGGASHGNMSLEALSKNRQSWRGIPSPMCFEVWRWPQIPPRRKDSILQRAVLPPFILQELTGKSMPNEAHSMSTHESNVPCSWYLQRNTSAWKKIARQNARQKFYACFIGAIVVIFTKRNFIFYLFAH